MALKDYATSTVAVAPSPATSGTTLEVQSGHGSRFPAAPFFVTAHPDGNLPTLDNSEKLLVTAKSGDEFTITRAQGDTTAKSISEDWRISNTVFVEDIPTELSDLGGDLDDIADGTTYVKSENNYDDTAVSKLAGIESGADVTDAGNVGSSINGASGKTTPVDADTTALIDSEASNVLKKITFSNLKLAILAATYPVGCIYFSTNSTNPATSLGFGTWSAFGAGRVPVGFDSGQTEFDTDEETGGSKTVTLTAAQSGVPAHSHTITDPGHSHTYFRNLTGAAGTARFTSTTSADNTTTTTNTTGITIDNNTPADASQAHTNLQPYIVVRMWKRTA